MDLLQGIIGFTLSRGKDILDGVRSKPHVCQLSQFDQGDTLRTFFINFQMLQIVNFCFFY